MAIMAKNVTRKRRFLKPFTRCLRGRWWVILKRRRLVEQLFFSSLTRRIVFLNLTALAVLLMGIMYLNQFRDGLIDAKIESLRIQGEIIAGAIATSSSNHADALLISPEKLLDLQAGQNTISKSTGTDNWDFPINPERVAPFLRRIIKPKTTRARIYDDDCNLLLDSKFLYLSSQIFSYQAPDMSQTPRSFWQKMEAFFSHIFYGGFASPVSLANKNIAEEVAEKALSGHTATAQNRNNEGQLIVYVAVPVQRFHTMIGALVLSTIGSDIDHLIKAERVAIFKVFATVASVLLVLSLFLAYTVANPLHKLAAAADRVRNGHNKRVAIPDFSERHDEVGHLSSAISAMTDALYLRIEAIERFAADVSHELKNPLTSLRSAVETLPLAKNQATRDKLLSIIEHDVRRLDRLITDIADASRLDAELGREAMQKVDMVALLESLVGAAREVQKGKHRVAIELNIAPYPGRCSYMVTGHDLRLGQVISNLIENARSFVSKDNGLIRVMLSSTKTMLKVVVEDNGPGIRAQNIERIFERFYTDRPEEDAFGQNSGLGLSISRQIIEAHYGTLSAENIYDPVCGDKKKGARFIILLPLLR
ncbi:stimulus-sensing domain-containing protein [Bartonella sp. DGB2]|uniref:stimulus-sensing domain-containing protein n=1 Tax=Bartonella sp. DGB2 TaxID=3388426 RepID=UPI0039903013